MITITTPSGAYTIEVGWWIQLGFMIWTIVILELIVVAKRAK